jgi:hypothetical protein
VAPGSDSTGAGVAHDAGTDLDQFELQAGERQVKG